jgi:hypothetical protein
MNRMPDFFSLPRKKIKQAWPNSPLVSYLSTEGTTPSHPKSDSWFLLRPCPCRLSDTHSYHSFLFHSFFFMVCDEPDIGVSTGDTLWVKEPWLLPLKWPYHHPDQAPSTQLHSLALEATMLSLGLLWQLLLASSFQAEPSPSSLCSWHEASRPASQ